MATESLPYLQGDGPPECSSSMELSVWPSIIYDVNNYYRDLGVTPWATKGDLVWAYQATAGHLQDGPGVVRLTYVLKQLLNKRVRLLYDMCPLGSEFFDDYVRDRLKREMLKHKADRLDNLRDLGVDMDRIDEASIERDIYSEMGYDSADVEYDEDDEDTPPEVVDADPPEVQDRPHPAERFPYAYYLLSVPWVDQIHEQRLARWQRFLVSALSQEGIHIKFAVGYHGGPHPAISGTVGYRSVFFLGRHETPTEELAGRTVRQFAVDKGLLDEPLQLATSI